MIIGEKYYNDDGYIGILLPTWNPLWEIEGEKIDDEYEIHHYCRYDIHLRFDKTLIEMKLSKRAYQEVNEYIAQCPDYELNITTDFYGWEYSRIDYVEPNKLFKIDINLDDFGETIKYYDDYTWHMV